MADEIGFKSAAWSIDGARIDSGLMRLLAYAATGGSEGIVAPGDCLVHQLGVPGTRVEIDTGALLILNRSANVRNQTYVADGSQITRLDVQATTASGPRSDLVIVRLEDPEFDDWGDIPEGEEPDWQYARPIIIQNVPANTTSFAQLGLGYSAYALARIDIPVSTGTITNAHIKDLRKVARPRREPFNDRYDHDGRANDLSTTTLNVYGKFPAGIADASLVVPDWATKLVVRVSITGLTVAPAVAGAFRFSLIGGSPSSTVSSKTTYANEQTGLSERNTYLVGSTIDIPASMRGRTVAGRLEFMKRGGSGRFGAGADTQLVVDLDYVGAVA